MRRAAWAAIVLAGVLTASSASAAAPYPPPSEGQGSAAPSRVKQGECTTFSGNGFASGAAVTVTDDGRPAGTARADDKGRFRAEVCFATNATVGQHVLAGRGTADQKRPGDPLERQVTATVTVTGVEQSGGGGGGNGGGGGGNGGGGGGGGGKGVHATPAAGVAELAVSPFGIALLLLLLTPLVCGLLLGFDRRHRRRRSG